MQGIWHYLTKYSIPEQFQLTQNEGDTLFSKINFSGLEIGLKHEYLNPNQSFKDRSLAFQLSYYLSQNIEKFVISSSGNAAVSAASYLFNTNAKLDIFVSDKINQQKLARIEKFVNSRIEIHKSIRAKSDAIKFAHENNSLNLRGSKDAQALVGFKTISFELIKQYPQIDAIFIPCSSATSSVGIANGFAELDKKIQIHIVQTVKINSIAREYSKDYTNASSSLADAITDRIALRKSKINEIIKETNGYGWIASDEQLKSIKVEMLEKHKLDLSYNSLLSLVGLHQALKLKRDIKFPVALLSGL